MAKKLETRVERLEDAEEFSGVLALNYEGEPTVKFINPLERRGEIMLYSDFEKENPDGKIIRIVYVKDWRGVEELGWNHE